MSVSRIMVIQVSTTLTSCCKCFWINLKNKFKTSPASKGSYEPYEMELKNVFVEQQPCSSSTSWYFLPMKSSEIIQSNQLVKSIIIYNLDHSNYKAVADF